MKRSLPASTPRMRPCLDALDTDDSGELDLTDAVYCLTYQLLAGPPPSAPFPGCGVDMTEDDLGCERFAGCP